MTRYAPFKDQQVKSIFARYPDGLRSRLMELRQLIIDTAGETAGVSAITETLKWNEPAYLPKKSNVGTTIRINALKGSPTRYAMFVHCQTTLIETYRQHYSDQLDFEGNRAVIFDTGHALPREPLKHCIALALTYHMRSSGRSV
jgi:hypothetical protein